MRNELNKKIRSICDEVGTSAAAERCAELTNQLDAEFDERVRAGMSELDAYRDVLKNVDGIRAMLNSLPRTDSEQTANEAKKQQETGNRKLKDILGAVSTCMWLLIVIVYILFSFSCGWWKLSWLIFVWGAIPQTILDMVLKINKGKPKKKVIRSGLSSIMWLCIVIIYFIGSFVTEMWGISWIIFIVGALIETILNAAFGKS